MVDFFRNGNFRNGWQSYLPLQKSGYYKHIESDNKDITEHSIPGIYLQHYYTEEDALARTKLSLSFRQVSSFKEHSFKFYALTTESITANYKISFLIFVTKEDIQQEEPLEITCTSEKAVDASSDIVAVTFNCPVDEDAQYLDIISSKYVVGLPKDPTLLNPSSTDLAFSEGKSKDKSSSDLPALLKIDDKAFNYDDTNKGILEFTLPLGNLKNDKIKVDNYFEFYFKYPMGVPLKFIIVGIVDTSFTLRGEINGKLDNQPLVFEQSIIAIDEEEVFVMPGFATEAITYSGEGGEKTHVISSITSEVKQILTIIE